ncbi:MAG: tripartite tricarboxylate transporter permease [Pseudomonadota bacterium]
MDWYQHLVTGWSSAWTAQTLAMILLGGFLGLLMGVLPGLGPVVALALVLPWVGPLNPMSAMALLASVYIGGHYGALTVRSLVLPAGPAESAPMALDAHQLTRRGRGGLAVAVASLSSTVAALGALVVMWLTAPWFTELAFHFGPAEYFSLMVLSLVAAVAVSPGSLVKALAMIVLGLLLGQVGADQASKVFHQLAGVPSAFAEIDLVVLVIGLFVFGEVLAALGQPAADRAAIEGALGAWRPSRDELRRAHPAVWRGTALGTVLGLLPGGGAVLASLASRTVERRLAGGHTPLGRGEVRGVAGPHAALQAGAQSAFMPLLTFGIPLNAAMALLIGAMTLKSLAPGPQLMSGEPGFFWGLIAALGISHGVVLVLHLPLLRLWIGMAGLRFRFVYPAVVLMGCLGVYALRGEVLDLYLAAGLGVAGYVFHKLRCPLGPLLLGFVLGPMMEASLRGALQPAGDWRTLVSRPVSLTLLLAAAMLVGLVLLPSVRRPRGLAFKEE